MIKLVCGLVLGAVLVGSPSVITGQVSSLLEGKWSFREFVEDKESGKQCRPLHITSRTYDLKRRMDGRLEGYYWRDYRVIWLGDSRGCPRSISMENWNALHRIDNWYVYATREGNDHVIVAAEHNECAGACDNQMYTLERFETKLYRSQEGLVDEPQDGTPEMVFHAQEKVRATEKDAARRMYDMVRPMYEGKCNTFFEENLDVLARITLRKSEFCLVVQRLADLMLPVLYRQPIIALRFDWGELNQLVPGKKRTPIQDGTNVLVEEFWVLSGDGSGVPIATVLRLNEAGEWKVLVPMP